MTSLALLAALVLQHYAELPRREEIEDALSRAADRLRESLDAGQVHHGALAWCAFALPAPLVALALERLFHPLNAVLSLVFEIGILYVAIEFKPTVDHLGRIRHELHHERLDDARMLLSRWHVSADPAADVNELSRLSIEQALLRFHRRFSAPVFWFAILPGTSGALLYMATCLLGIRWGSQDRTDAGGFGRWARIAFDVLDWLPLRVTALGFAVAGNFEDAVFCWRTQARPWNAPHEGAVLAAGAGALGVRLGEPLHVVGAVQYRPELGVEETTDPDHLQSAEGLMWRAAALWVGLLILMNVAAWFGD
jgi:adenosylcobinamide-phosphate synthase